MKTSTLAGAGMVAGILTAKGVFAVAENFAGSDAYAGLLIFAASVDGGEAAMVVSIPGAVS